MGLGLQTVGHLPIKLGLGPILNAAYLTIFSLLLHKLHHSHHLSPSLDLSQTTHHHLSPLPTIVFSLFIERILCICKSFGVVHSNFLSSILCRFRKPLSRLNSYRNLCNLQGLPTALSTSIHSRHLPPDRIIIVVNMTVA